MTKYIKEAVEAALSTQARDPLGLEPPDTMSLEDARLYHGFIAVPPPSVCRYKIIFGSLQPYGCHEVVELQQLWDWAGAFKPAAGKVEGFCTSQYGSGMHEVYIRKDAQGIVRAKFRKSSKASTWLPEGEGLRIFKTDAEGATIIPEMPPPVMKPAKSDAAWGREAVMATIRAWCPSSPPQPPHNMEAYCAQCRSLVPGICTWLSVRTR